MPDSDDLPTCACCGFKHEDLKLHTTQMRGSDDDVELCDVCYSTFIGNAFLYPGQYDNAALYQALGYCTNTILQAIKDNARTEPR